MGRRVGFSVVGNGVIVGDALGDSVGGDDEYDSTVDGESVTRNGSTSSKRVVVAP